MVRNTYLLAGSKSALSTSSATIARKSRICSFVAPRLDIVLMHDINQSGHRDGLPGASFRARDVTWQTSYHEAVGLSK